MDDINYVERIKWEAINLAPDSETWPGHYRLRAKEFEVLANYFEVKNVKRILEIGCGNGFNSSILSNFCDLIVATDLPSFDVKTHTIGMGKAVGLIKKLNVTNCNLVGNSAHNLPFLDNSFDLVFAEYVLEHVPDKNKALIEIRRVLNEDGYLVSLIPNFVERLFYFPVFYFYLLKRLICHFLQKQSSVKKIGHDSNEEEFQEQRSYKRFRKNNPNFPFPEPHGCYKNFFVEIYNQFPKIWINCHKKSGMKVVSVFTTMLFPVTFFGMFCNSINIYEKLSWLHKLGGSFLFKYIGQNICIICKK